MNFLTKKKKEIEIIIITLLLLLLLPLFFAPFFHPFPLPSLFASGSPRMGGGGGGLFERGFKQESGEVSSPVTSGFSVRYLFTSYLL